MIILKSITISYPSYSKLNKNINEKKYKIIKVKQECVTTH